MLAGPSGKGCSLCIVGFVGGCIRYQITQSNRHPPQFETVEQVPISRNCFKGPYIKDVRKISGIFYPLPPLSAFWADS